MMKNPVACHSIRSKSVPFSLQATFGTGAIFLDDIKYTPCLDSNQLEPISLDSYILMSGTVTIFYGAVVTPVCPRTWKALPRCLIVVGRYGNINFMREHVEDHKLDEVLREHGYADHYVKRLQDGEFIIPGFVDTHTHAPQYPNLGKGGQYTLLQWLENVIFPKEAEFANTKFAKEVYHEVVRRSLAFGVR
ncbi:putative guanine deaminase [Leucoagaricus sp. SymC.cos]|nr:putative guanine deaminase [Leucoagaricus sp. SymC.cos]